MKRIVSRAFTAGFLMSALAFPASQASADSTLYFTRHAEDSVELLERKNGLFEPNCVGKDNEECCIEPLDPLGEKRAEELAEWFERKNISDNVTHVIASHKVRTQQTVQSIADDAGVELQNVPAGVADCDVGFESSSASRKPMLDFILNELPQESTLVVGAHSGTIYEIFEDLGIDTTDPEIFPRSSSGKVLGHKNLWKLKKANDGVFVVRKHFVIDLNLTRDQN